VYSNSFLTSDVFSHTVIAVYQVLALTLTLALVVFAVADAGAVTKKKRKAVSPPRGRPESRLQPSRGGDEHDQSPR